MSDINEFLNDNEGYYTALGGLAGISQRNRLLDTQHRQIQQQAEHSRQIAAHARRVEALESQRLEVEERRLEFERQRVADEQERRDEIREVRRCLSSLMTELDALSRIFATTCKGYSPELTVRLATLQVACSIVTKRDILEELSDMQALSKFDRDLGIFIAEKAREGATWTDPLLRIAEEENARFTLAQQAIKLLDDSSVAIKTLCARPLYSFSKDEIHSLRKRIAATQKTFPPELTVLEKQLRDSCPSFTTNTKAQITVLRSMTGSGEPLKKLLSSAKLAEADIFGDNGERGVRFAELKSGLKWATTECDAWKAAVDQAIEKLARIRSAAKAGNHKTAERLIAEVPQGVEGFDYLELDDRVSMWSEALARHEGVWKKVEIEVASLISNRSLKHFVSRFSLCRNCGVALSRYLESAVPFAQHAQSLPECEYKTAALALLKHNEGLAADMRNRARATETKHIILFITYCIGAIAALFLTMYVVSLIKARQQGDSEQTTEAQSAMIP